MNGKTPCQTIPQRLRSHLNETWILALGDQVVCSGGNFLAGVIIGRHCPREQFGIYLLAFSLLLVCIDIQAALIWTPYTINIPLMSAHGRRIYTVNCCVHQTLFSLVVSLVLGSSAAVLLMLGTFQNYSAVATLLVFSAPMLLFREGARRSSFALLRFRAAFITDILITTVQLLLLLYFARNGVMSAATALKVSSVTATVGLALWFWLVWREIGVRPVHVRAQFVQNWSTGGWVFLSGVVWTVLSNIYPWVLSMLRGNDSAAAWGACIGVTASCNPLLLGIQNLIGPRIAHTYAEGGTRPLKRTSLEYSVGFCAALLPIGIILSLAGGSVVRWVYGPSYAGHGTAVAILALNLIAVAAGFAPSRALFSLGRARLDTMVNIGALGVTVILCIPLVKAYGIIGAACCLLAINASCAILRHSFVRYASKDKVCDESTVCCSQPVGTI